MPSLNGGRAIAAFLVFGGHFLALQFATPVGAAGVYDADSTGRGASDSFFFHFFGAFIPVPINYFFILSGFVLATIYRPGQSAIAFWIKRIGKVYPVYIATTAVAFVLWGVLGSSWTSWKIVLAHVFLLQAWTPDQSTLFGLNVAMWTLSNEVFLYLLFPAFILMLRQFTKRGLQLTALVCVICSFALPAIVGSTFTLRNPPPAQAPLEGFDNEFIYWFTLMFPPVRMFQFALGICLALLLRKGIKYVPSLPVAGLIFAAGLAITDLWLPVEMQNLSGMMIPIAILILAMAKADLRGRRTPFKWKPLLFLGKISYSFYAVHIMIILFTIVHVPGPSGAWDYIRIGLADIGLISDPKAAVPDWLNVLLLVAYFAVTTLIAWVMARFVEQPVSRVAQRWAARVPKPPAPLAIVEPAQAPEAAALAIADGPSEKRTA